MRSNVHLVAGIMALFGLLLSSPTAGYAGENCPSAVELLDFAKTESAAPSASLLPASAKMAEGFQPGAGSPAGKVQTVQGTVLVIHKESSDAYGLKKDAEVFNGDTLVTEKNSRITLQMKDKSMVTLTAQSKMVIDRSVYNHEADRRDTKLQLLLGRLRTIVSKVTGESSYLIKTPTAVAGARGTDFGLAVAPAPQAPSSLMTVLVTGGGNSTVQLTDEAGGSVTVGPLSVTGAVAACPVCPPVQVGQSAVNTLNAIAPELDLAVAAGSSTTAWMKTFLEEAKKFGLDWAVENALDKGIAPADILAFIVRNQEQLTHPSLKALYCAGIDREVVQNAADLLGITGETTSRAFEESITECSSKVALQDRDILDIPTVEGKFVSPSKP